MCLLDLFYNHVVFLLDFLLANHRLLHLEVLVLDKLAQLEHIICLLTWDYPNQSLDDPQVSLEIVIKEVHALSKVAQLRV